MHCSSPGSSVHGVFQARILEWAAISFSRASSWPRILTQVYCIGGRFFTNWATKEGLEILVVDISRRIYLHECPFGWLSVPKPDSMELPIGLCWGCVCMMLSHFSHVQLFGTLCTVARQPPLFMRFSRQECCSGLPCSSPGYLPDPGVKPASLLSPPLAGRLFTWKALILGCLRPKNKLDRDTDPPISWQAAKDFLSPQPLLDRPIDSALPTRGSRLSSTH